MGGIFSKKKKKKKLIIRTDDDNKSLQPLNQITIETIGECCICHSEMKIGYHLSSINMDESKFVCKVCCVDMFL